MRRQMPGGLLLCTGGYCLLALMGLALSALAGCSGVQRHPPIEVWDDMKRQGKFKPQAEGPRLEDGAPLFADVRVARRPAAGTVARGHLKEDTPFYTGMEGGLYTGKNPLPITMGLLQTGQRKFNTYCSPCHDRAGTGQGIVPQRTLMTWQPTNLTEERVRNFNDGEIFYVMTNGRRSMPSYRFQLAEQDRWAIVAYVRALERAAAGTLADVPPELRLR